MNIQSNHLRIDSMVPRQPLGSENRSTLGSQDGKADATLHDCIPVHAWRITPPGVRLKYGVGFVEFRVVLQIGSCISYTEVGSKCRYWFFWSTSGLGERPDNR